MRIRYFFIPLLTLSLFCSCSKGDNSIEESTVNSMTFTISEYKDSEHEFDTRTSIGEDGKFLWAAGDTVGIYPNTGSQVFFELTEGEGANSAVFDGGGWDFKASSTYYSYYPFIANYYLNRNRIPVFFLGQKQIGIASTSHIGPYDYMYTAGSSAESGNVHFTYHHLCCIIRFNLYLPAGSYSKLAITAPSEVLPIEGYFDLMSSDPTIIPTKFSKQISMDLEDITVEDNQQFYVYMMSAPVNLKNVSITVSVLNGNKTELQCLKTPSYEYEKGQICKLKCDSWTEVPQSMSMFIQDWDNGENIRGNV